MLVTLALSTVDGAVTCSQAVIKAGCVLCGDQCGINRVFHVTWNRRELYAPAATKAADNALWQQHYAGDLALLGYRVAPKDSGPYPEY